MDLRLYVRVLWRFRLVVAIGFVVAIALAAFSTVKLGPNGLQYRQNELWASTVRLLVTQNGFPEGRLYAQQPTEGDAIPQAGDQAKELGIPVVDPGRFNSLAILYARLANTDPILRLMSKEGPVKGKLIAVSLRDDNSGILLPLIDVTAITDSPLGALSLAARNAKALDTYIDTQQQENKVPKGDRVKIETVVAPRQAVLFQPRSKTMPMVVFFAVMFATVGLSFLLENIRPRVRELGGGRADTGSMSAPTRRSA
jgi:hypothetical protein